MTEYRIKVAPLRAQRQALTATEPIVLYVGGIGSGKSWTGALWCAMSPPGTKILVVAPTYRILRDGTVATLKRIMPWGDWRKTEMTYTLPNGTVVYLRSAENLDDTVRSVEVDRVWLEEGAYIRRDAIQTAIGRMRASSDGRILVTTTPRKNAAVHKLWIVDAPDGVREVKSRSEDNPALSAAVIAMLRRDYGERLSAQELDGEWVDVTGGLFDPPNYGTAPRRVDMVRVVVGVDPNAGGGDECGIVVAGKTAAGHGWMLEDLSARVGATEWPELVCAAAKRWGATIVAEVNQGGDMVERAIRSVDKGARFEAVRAVKGKGERALPVAVACRQGLITHAEASPRLEAQMTGWDPTTSEGSPDRMDAYVWAMTALGFGVAAPAPAQWSPAPDPATRDHTVGDVLGARRAY